MKNEIGLGRLTDDEHQSQFSKEKNQSVEEIEKKVRFDALVKETTENEGGNAIIAKMIKRTQNRKKTLGDGKKYCFTDTNHNDLR